MTKGSVTRCLKAHPSVYDREGDHYIRRVNFTIRSIVSFQCSGLAAFRSYALAGNQKPRAGARQTTADPLGRLRCRNCGGVVRSLAGVHRDLIARRRCCRVRLPRITCASRGSGSEATDGSAAGAEASAAGASPGEGDGAAEGTSPMFCIIPPATFLPHRSPPNPHPASYCLRPARRRCKE